MSDNRVRSFENWGKGDINPSKEFISDFDIAIDGKLHRRPFDKDDREGMGKDALRLCDLVLGIKGVNGVTVSGREIRVYKSFTYKWSELTRQIQEAFETVYGKGKIKFIEENPVSHFVRKTRAELDLYKY